MGVVARATCTTRVVMRVECSATERLQHEQLQNGEHSSD